MIVQNPDFQWYSKRSREMHLTPRCPIASAELCPRYYASFWMLGKERITTEISHEDQIRLERKWKPFASIVAEEDVGIAWGDNRFTSISRLCPEVGFDVFGYFVSSFQRYANEIDSDRAHQYLGAQRIDSSDFRWYWESVTPRHYTECREYSIYSEVSSGKRRKVPRSRQALSPKVRWQVLARDSFTCQYCGKRPPEVPLEVDHKIALANGGTDDFENLISACAECNRGKGAQSIITN